MSRTGEEAGASTTRDAPRNRVARMLDLRAGEHAPVTAGLAVFFLLFAAYFMLRPVRETMGIASGVDQLQWLFTATFVATVAAMPLFGWLATRVARRRILPLAYGFFVANLVAFALGFALLGDVPWLARSFYVWLSLFTFIAVSLAWSLMADVFRATQAKRLFALLASGASAGGLVGPILGVALVGWIGHAGLLLLSAGLLAGAIVAARRLRRWRDAQADEVAEASPASTRALGGNAFDGATQVLRSPFLLGIAAFVLLLASATTFLYFEQARLIEAAFPLRTDQTRVFGIIDIVVQSLAILTQVFVTGRIAQRLGIGLLLTAVPLIVAAGFVWLALSPTFAVLAVVMVARRAGEYALVRPGREMLFTAVPMEARYKAKNFLDTVVYRGADSLSAWLKTVVDMLATHPALAALIGAGLALVWAATGRRLARAHALRVAPSATTAPPAASESPGDVAAASIR